MNVPIKIFDLKGKMNLVEVFFYAIFSEDLSEPDLGISLHHTVVTQLLSFLRRGDQMKIKKDALPLQTLLKSVKTAFVLVGGTARYT